MSSWGNKLRLSVFGESHGTEVGIVAEGLPCGFEIDMDNVQHEMHRRSPARAMASGRQEFDVPEIVSGLLNGKTTGTPLCAVIKNNDVRSADYENILSKLRPGHSDYSGFVKYKGYNDSRGSGHFSGRLTAPIVFLGAVCKQLLRTKGIHIGAHIYSIGNCMDTAFDSVNIDSTLLSALNKSGFALIDNSSVEEQMHHLIKATADKGDSIGGIAECAITGLPAGLGNPMFEGIENSLSSAVFAIPGIKGIEFGAGFGVSTMTGSENNDSFAVDEDGNIITETNNHGGILGGITTGMPVIFRVAVKPTPSITKEQKTVDINTKTGCTVSTQGRHDPCIVPRVVPCIEAVAAIVFTDLLLEEGLL